jgi:hypothetical protein
MLCRFTVFGVGVAWTAMSMAAPVYAPIDVTWSEQTIEKMLETLHHKTSGTVAVLPEVRVYDYRGRLILQKSGASIRTSDIVALTGKASLEAPPVEGPSLADILPQYVTKSGGPITLRALQPGEIVVLDYGAEWCAPCKVLSRTLDTWLSGSEAPPVHLVRVDADYARLLNSRLVKKPG